MQTQWKFYRHRFAPDSGQFCYPVLRSFEQDSACRMSETPRPQTTGNPTFDAIVAFTRSYHQALESELDQHGRERFPHHGERTAVVQIIKACDGFVTFYLPPPPPDRQVQEGYYVFDYSEYDLNAICQSRHVQRLKVASPRLGQPWNAFEIPPDTDYIPEFRGPLIHDDIRHAATEGKISSLQGMTISPVVHISGGIRERVVPQRVKIWSPVFDFAGVGTRRLYFWPHADFWWLPEQLDLDPDRAADVAHYDVVALQAVMAMEAAISPQVAQQDLAEFASHRLEELCDEFVALMENQGEDEEAIHQFLRRAENHLFLDSDYKDVHSKVQFGDYVSDFVVRRSDDSYKLVEIEPATIRIFTVSRSEPSARFNHACQQVRDWQDYIREHVHHVREVQRLPGIYEPKGMVLMGRSAHIDSGVAQRRWRAMKTESPFELATYDEAIERVRNLSTKLRHLLG